MMTTEIAPEKLEKVSRQFSKLMAKAKSTDFPEEAENCVALAQKLLWDANLDETQLLTVKDLEKRSKRTFTKDGVEVGSNKYAVNYNFNSREWKSELLEVLASNFFCKLHEGYAKVVTIVGEPKNIEIVKSLYAYLEKQIRASRRTAFNLAKENHEIQYAIGRYGYRSDTLSQFAVNAFKDSFAKGAVASIGRRLAEQQRENVEAANEAHASQATDLTAIGFGAALVVQINNELDEAFYEYFPELHPAKVALERYKREIEYQELSARLNKEREEREERIAAGLELPPKPEKVKEYKRRGRRPQYRNTVDNRAYNQGRVAGSSIQINPAIKGGNNALNK